MQQVAPSYGLVSFQFIVYERVAAFAQRYDVAAEYFQSGIVPAIFGGVFQITLFAAQQPKRGDYFAVSIGCVACNVTYPVADIVAWNPSVASVPMRCPMPFTRIVLWARVARWQ